MKLNNCIFKFLDVEDRHFFSNMENNELICKQYRDFNDPYESHFGINAHWPSPYKDESKLVQLIQRIEPDNFGTFTASKDSMNKYIQSHSNLRDYSLEKIKELLMSFRICSFTKRWNHVLMWAHYANGCRGLALIFDDSKILDCKNARTINSQDPLNGANIPLKWITYQSCPPILNAVDVLEAIRIGTEESIISLSKKILDICVLSKYRAWRYEQEIRMITKIEENVGEARVLYKYDPMALKGAIFGSKCDPENIKKVSKLLPEECTVFLTKPAASRYKVKIVQKWKAGQIANGEVEINQIIG